jgi:hypothetical protein
MARRLLEGAPSAGDTNSDHDAVHKHWQCEALDESLVEAQQVAALVENGTNT